MAEAAKKRRLNKVCSASSPFTENKIFPEEPLAPATNRDKQNWKGFCEIESEPAFFNVMLKDFGVRGVKVQEVVSLDDEILTFLPTPIYGLIFLYKWHEESIDEQKEKCPDNVWFANQTVKNACASVALLNIVNNVSGLELGDHLQAFKDFTTDFIPVMRGEAVANFDFIREIHNSFARKIDMLDADLQLKNDATPKKRRKQRAQFEEDEAAFHFIAFVPVESKLWKLDGLQRQPQDLGKIEREDWVGQVKPEIEARMAECEEGQIEFAILSLVKDPLLSHVTALAVNVKSIIALERRLDNLGSDWKSCVANSTLGEGVLTNGNLTSPDPGYELCQAMLDQAAILPSIIEALQSDLVSEIIARRQELVTEQARLRLAITEEQQSRRSDEERAVSRRHDHGPLVSSLLEILEHKVALESLLT